MLTSNSFHQLVELFGLLLGSGCLFANWRNEDVKMRNVEANGISATRFHRHQPSRTSMLWGFVSAAE
jgi:hypothetical protein